MKPLGLSTHVRIITDTLRSYNTIVTRFTFPTNSLSENLAAPCAVLYTETRLFSELLK